MYLLSIASDMLPSVILTNTFGIVLLVCLLINIIQHRRKMMKLDDKIFNALIIAVITLCSMEIITFALDEKTFFGARELALITNSLLFSSAPVAGLFWILYVDYKMYRQKDRLKKLYIIAGIPALLNLIVSFANIFTPIFFSISENNEYSRIQPFVYIPVVIAFVYLIYSLLLTATATKNIKRYMFAPTIIFAVPIALAAILQFTFYGISIIWPAAGIAIMSVYINLQNEFLFIDHLTGLYNRGYLFGYTFHTPDDKLYAGILIDADHFKSINNTYGHLVGDSALKEIANVLQTAAINNKGLAFRYAGDEFILLCLVDNEDAVLKIIDEINKMFDIRNQTKKRPYELTVSMGYTFLNNDDESLDDFIKRMDEAMYNTKRAKQKLDNPETEIIDEKVTE